jgi:hypothetical protein
VDGVGFAHFGLVGRALEGVEEGGPGPVDDVVVFPGGGGCVNDVGVK